MAPWSTRPRRTPPRVEIAAVDTAERVGAVTIALRGRAHLDLASVFRYAGSIMRLGRIHVSRAPRPPSVRRSASPRSGPITPHPQSACAGCAGSTIEGAWVERVKRGARTDPIEPIRVSDLSVYRFMVNHRNNDTSGRATHATCDRR